MQYEYRATTHAGASSKIQLGVGHRPRNEDEDEQLQISQMTRAQMRGFVPAIFH